MIFKARKKNVRNGLQEERKRAELTVTDLFQFLFKKSFKISFLLFEYFLILIFGCALTCPLCSPPKNPESVFENDKIFMTKSAKRIVAVVRIFFPVELEKYSKNFSHSNVETQFE